MRHATEFEGDIMAEMRLTEIIERVENRTLVIPDFQRGFKWKATDIRKLMESILLDFPIGAALFWKTNSNALMYRLVEDVEFVNEEDGNEDEDESGDRDMRSQSDVPPEEIFFILDGQQRVTSIYKMFPPSVAPSDHEVKSRLRGLRYFLDLKRLGLPLELSDIERTNFNQFNDPEALSEAIVEKSHPDLRKAFRNHVGGIVPQRLSEDDINELCSRQYWLPITRSLLENRTSFLNRLQRRARTVVDEKRDSLISTGKEQVASTGKIDKAFDDWADWFTSTYFRTLNSKQFTYISLAQEKPDGLARIFETINSTGMQLSVFDLLVARLGTWKSAGEQTNLRKTILDAYSRDSSSVLGQFDDPKSLGGTATQQVPRALALKAGMELNKGEILKVPREDYQPYLNSIGCDTISALKFLRDKVGINHESKLPFRDLLTLAIALHDKVEESKKNLLRFLLFAVSQIEDWDFATNEKTKKWHKRMVAALEDADEAYSILANFEEKFPTFEDVIGVSRKGRTYRILMAYNLSRGGVDWSGEIRDPKTVLEDHHLFPRDWINNNRAQTNSDSEWQALQNSILNRIMVTKDANRTARAQVPPNYLGQIGVEDRRVLQIPDCFLGPLSTPISFHEISGYMEQRYNMVRNDMINEFRQSIQV